ncbi:MAG: DUF1573 domain-containing protein [Sedimentisphaerales bacterium]|nr:DUF1573 domain-containing protein [Sedimentisphaerales bacterium]
MRSFTNRRSACLLGGLLFLAAGFSGCPQPPAVPADGGSGSMDGPPVSSGPGASGPTSTASADAGLLVADRDRHDFGPVEGDKTLSTSFALKNESDHPLRIKNVESSCGCLVPKLATYSLEPHQSVPLSVSFTSPTTPGRTTKTIWVYPEPPARPAILVLQVTCEVKAYVVFRPEELQLTFQAEAPVPDLTVYSEDEQPFRITGYRVTNQTLELEWDRQTQANRHVLRVKPDRPRLREHPEDGFLSLELTHPKRRELIVPIRVIPPYATYPSIRRFDELGPGQSKIETITIVSNYQVPFTLGQIRSEQGHVEVTKTSPIPGGYKLEVRMTVPADLQDTQIKDFLQVASVEEPDYKIRILCYAAWR